MAEMLILRFTGVGQAQYDAVNAALGLNPQSGEGSWPEGLRTHSAGTTDGGEFVVSEVWESQAAQGAFMQGRLGAALAAGGVGAPTSVEWVPLIAHLNPT